MEFETEYDRKYEPYMAKDGCKTGRNANESVVAPAALSLVLGSLLSVLEMADLGRPAHGIAEKEHGDHHIVERLDRAGLDVLLVVVVQKAPRVLRHIVPRHRGLDERGHVLELHARQGSQP